MNRAFLKTLCATAILFFAQTGSAQEVVINCKATLQAQPFKPGTVRLKDGVYKETLDINYEYLLHFNTLQLVHNFRANAGLPNTVSPMAGWESPWSELRGHFTGHFLSALGMMYAATGDERLKLKADTLIHELSTVQQALGTSGYLSAYPESFIDRVEAGTQVWAPYYTLHKILAGLVDAYLYFDNPEALETAKRMGNWFYTRNNKLTYPEREKMLLMEYGGVGESLWNLYAITRDAKYKDAAMYFHQDAFLNPLKNYTDKMTGMHANTQFPKVVAAARQYELTADPVYKNLSIFFWEEITNARSYVTGGNSNYEHFRSEPWKLADMLGPYDHENCNTYNMLKLTEHLFCWEPRAEYADYYERAALNGILGTQHPEVGGTAMYYIPMRPGMFRAYSEPSDSYFCCSGSGIESYSKFGNCIYYHQGTQLWVNQFIASELIWEEQNVTLTQDTRFPDEDHMQFTLKAKRPVELCINLRVPYWATQGCILKINGKKQDISSSPSSYLSIKRVWKSGDKIEFTLPMSLHTWTMPDNPTRTAVLYGPVVLAAALGQEAMTDRTRRGIGHDCYNVNKEGATIDVPAIVTTNPNWLKQIEPIEGTPLTFRTKGLGVPADFTLKPFFRMHGERYSLYTDVYTPGGWAEFTSRYRTFPESVYDRLEPGDSISMYDHSFQCFYLDKGETEGKEWVQSKSDFHFDLRIPLDKEVKLRVTYHGDETATRYTMKIDGVEFTPTALPDKAESGFFEHEYILPFELTKGKKRIAIGYAVPQKKEVEVGATTVEKKEFKYVTPKLYGAEIRLK